MGEVRAKIVLKNLRDVILQKEPNFKKTKIRTIVLDGLVDTGAVKLLLPQDAVEALGLVYMGKRIVVLANEQKYEMEMAGTILLTVCDRTMSIDCLVGPPGCEPLIGQIVMEDLDLIPDPVKRTLTPRPESPFLPTLKMK